MKLFDVGIVKGTGILELQGATGYPFGDGQDSRVFFNKLSENALRSLL